MRETARSKRSSRGARTRSHGRCSAPSSPHSKLRPRRTRAFAVGQLAAACVALAAVIDHDLLEAWNDHPSRTKEDVLDALDRAAAHAADTPMSDL